MQCVGWEEWIVCREPSFSFAVEVAELQLILAAFLLGVVEHRAERIQLGLRRVPLACDVHLVFPAVDEVRRDGRGDPVRARRQRYEAQAHVALQGVAVGAAGGVAGQLAVAIDGLAPPGPQVQLGVVVLQYHHSEAAAHAVLALLHQGLPTHKVHVLMEGGTEIHNRLILTTDSILF